MGRLVEFPIAAAELVLAQKPMGTMTLQGCFQHGRFGETAAMNGVDAQSLPHGFTEAAVSRLGD